MICQFHLFFTATHEADVTHVVATISLKRTDFCFVVRGYNAVPVQPQAPAIGQGVSQFNVHDARPFPVPAAPGRRMQAPEILGPPAFKMLGNGALDFPHQPGTGNSHLTPWLHKPSKVVQVQIVCCLLYTSPSPRDGLLSRMPSSA